MKKKICIPIGIVTIFILSIIFLKDFTLKYIIEKEASKGLKQEVTLKYAHLNIFKQTITLTDFTLPKNGIVVSKINFDLDIPKAIKNKEVDINTLTVNDIKNIEKVKKIVPVKSTPQEKTSNIDNDASKVFFKELTKEVAIQNNLSNIFSGNFNSKAITLNLSNNFFDFLIKNVDYVDIILEKELNRRLKNDILNFNKGYIKFTNSIENFKKEKPLEYSLNIQNFIFNGNFQDIKYQGTLKNLSSNLNEDTNIPVDITISQKNNSGRIYGNYNFNTLNGEFHVKAPKINLLEINGANEYVENGNLFIEQTISLNPNAATIIGETRVSNLKLNKDSIVNHLNTTSLNKSLILKTLDFVDSNITSFTANTNFNSRNNFISLKTSLPDQLKGILIRNKDILNKDISKTIEKHYEQVIEKKKNNFNNLIDKFKDIF